MVVLDGNFVLGCGPGTDYISMYVRTNTWNKERHSRTNCVRSSIPHCIYCTLNCIISINNALMNNTVKLLDINKAVNCPHVCNFKSKTQFCTVNRQAVSLWCLHMTFTNSSSPKGPVQLWVLQTFFPVEGVQMAERWNWTLTFTWCWR